MKYRKRFVVMTPQQITAIATRSSRRGWVGSNRGHDRYNRSIVDRIEDMMDTFFLTGWKELLGYSQESLVMCSLCHLDSYKREYIEIRRYKGKSRGGFANLLHHPHGTGDAHA